MTPERQSRKQAIYSAGVTLFMESGFEKATMRKIARRAEVGLGTIYGYYTGKDAILVEFLTVTVDRLSQVVKDMMVSGLPPEEQLRRLVTSHVRYLSRNVNIAKLLFIDAQLLGTDAVNVLAKERERYQELLSDLIGRAQERGAFTRVCDPEWAAAAVLGAVGAVIVMWLGRGVKAVIRQEGCLPDLDDIAGQAFDMVMQGLQRSDVGGERESD